MTSADRDDATDEAAQMWLIRMRGEDADLLRSEFEAWHDASPEHCAAYHRAGKLLEQSAVLKGSRRYGPARARSPTRPQTPSRPRPWTRQWLMTGALAAAAAMLFVAFNAGGTTLSSPYGTNPMAAWAAEPLVTKHGEIRRFHLDDGSVATLDTDSRLEVAMSSDARHVRLVKGRARLQIADDARPFRIEAGAGVVTASQASLDIAREADGMIAVTLAKGAASIAAADEHRGSPQPLQLVAGRAFEYRASAPVLSLEARPATQDMSDWPSGWAEYRVIRLDQLVAQANRYAAVPVIIRDPAIARLEASGRFRISQTDSFIERVSRLFGLVAERRADGIYLRSR